MEKEAGRCRKWQGLNLSLLYLKMEAGASSQQLQLSLEARSSLLPTASKETGIPVLQPQATNSANNSNEQRNRFSPRASRKESGSADTSI